MAASKLPVVIALMAVILISGCATSGSSAATTLPAAATTVIPATTTSVTSALPTSTTIAAASNTILIQDFSFQPSELTVKSGSTVTWTNQDSASHTIVMDSSLGGFDSGLLAKGQNYSYDFTRAGNYSYHCSLHLSMKGKIMVD